MIPRRRFLLTTALAAAANGIRPLQVRAADRPALSFGVVADPQYADIAPAGTRHYRQSVAKLSEAVAHFNKRDLAFAVNLGDLIDRNWASFEAILEPLARCRHRFHHVLGNHDFDVADADKPRVPARLGRTARYGSFELGAWAFVVLDTNDVSLYAHPENSPAHAEARTAYERFAATGAPNAQTWNGAVGERQLEWFEATCRAAALADRRVIVMAHHPRASGGRSQRLELPTTARCAEPAPERRGLAQRPQPRRRLRRLRRGSVPHVSGDGGNGTDERLCRGAPLPRPDGSGRARPRTLADTPLPQRLTGLVSDRALAKSGGST
ncbi:MAG: metallophosphoesterase [Verrucomicrobia bacterium]|nr:metallophosphoesterase [Verrucomicrobiota bacterium]